MLGRVVSRAVPARGFASALRLSQTANESTKEFLTPNEFVQKKRQEEVEDLQFKQSLLQDQLEYNPKTITSNKLEKESNRPVPLNVELLKYKPIRLPQTHGHEVAELKFRGYEEEELIRASEFAARAAFFLGIPCSPVKSLKTEKRLYTVIKSPFAQAKTKENFHRVTYNRKLTAYDANPEVVDMWLSYVNKHAFDKVKYLAQIQTKEQLDFVETLDKLTSKDMKLPEAYSSDSSDPIAAKVQELLKSDTFKKFFDEETK